ncbi:MAG: DUF4180 domain-containing protein [Bacteroidota bacterium]|nr:DUF4180 domain-containing protein [Bacteroidota bacterium]
MQIFVNLRNLRERTNFQVIKYHAPVNNRIIAEVMPDSGLISGPDDILDLIVEARSNGSDFLILHKENLHYDFFDLKTGVAGEILQKFSNYRMKLAIIGDFSAYTSKSLLAFISESNRGGVIRFVASLNEVLSGLNI